MRHGQQVVLHIGAMKTGTTFLQHVLEANADPLTADGARFAGGQWRDQVRGVRDVLDMTGPKSGLPKPVGAWDQLVDDMGGSDLRSIISMEFLSFAHRPGAQRVVTSLSPAEVHVVLSVRSAGRVLPAQWQEQVQNRSTISWRQWCEDVPTDSDPPSDARRAAERALGVTRMVNAWAALVPPERFHVITVPPPGSDPSLLWERFAEALRLSAERYHVPDAPANTSLGHVSSELLRRLNERVTGGGYHTIVKELLAKSVLGQITDDRPVRLSPELVASAQRWDAAAVAALSTLDCHLVGDLADLQVQVPVDYEPVIVTDADLLVAARQAIPLLRAALRERGRAVPDTAEPADVESALDQVVAMVSRRPRAHS
jgi:hypothetical protein